MADVKKLPQPSPIERILLFSMAAHALLKNDIFSVFYQGTERGHITWVIAKYKFDVHTQFKIEQFYVDLFIVCSRVGDDQSTSSLVVECDGHEFHEKTKEQVERDKSRERAIVSAGYRLLRYAGSEINRNPDACAREIRECLLKHLPPTKQPNSVPTANAQ